MSRREFIAGVGAAGASLAGSAVAACPVAGQIITTPADGPAVAESKVPAGDFQVPIYEARPKSLPDHREALDVIRAVYLDLRCDGP